MYAFANCSNLTAVTIGANVTYINWYAFSGCSSLTSIVSLIDNVFRIDDNVFAGVSSDCILMVNQGQRTTYLNTDGWTTHMNAVEEFKFVDINSISFSQSKQVLTMKVIHQFTAEPRHFAQYNEQE